MTYGHINVGPMRAASPKSKVLLSVVRYTFLPNWTRMGWNFKSLEPFQGFPKLWTMDRDLTFGPIKVRQMRAESNKSQGVLSIPRATCVPNLNRIGWSLKSVEWMRFHKKIKLFSSQLSAFSLRGILFSISTTNLRLCNTNYQYLKLLSYWAAHIFLVKTLLSLYKFKYSASVRLQF